MNPETDFALGHGGEYFTPKASIVQLRRKLASLPSLWAEQNDLILTLDDTAASQPNLLTPVQLKEMADKDFSAIRPWGWNPSIKRLLLNCGMASALLPSAEAMHNLREAAHRKTTIAMHRVVSTDVNLQPLELTSAETVMKWCSDNPYGYLKAPWSSSGRGVFRALPGSGKELHNWVVGTLARQHSILAEPDWKQDLDFATEWSIIAGEPRFLGYSLFNVDNHNQYQSNSPLSQSEITSILQSRGWTKNHIKLQQRALECVIGHRYTGPLGIDCLYSPQYGFNLCVEINLRMTMGIVTLIRDHVIRHQEIYDYTTA